MGRVGSKIQIQHFWDNSSKLALKDYSKDLQPGFPHFAKM